MNLEKKLGIPKVQIDPDAIKVAHAVIVKHYDGIDRKNMEDWLGRFIAQVHDDPLGFLGYPPLRAETDPDLLYYPAREHHKIAAITYARTTDRMIHIYEFVVALPAAAIAEREANDAALVKKAGSTPSEKRRPNVKAFEDKGLNKRRKS